MAMAATEAAPAAAMTESRGSTRLPAAQRPGTLALDAGIADAWLTEGRGGRGTGIVVCAADGSVRWLAAP